jgi:hypothetical protein
MIAMISLASGNENMAITTSVSVAQPQTATQNVPARAKHKRLVKSKVQRPIPFNMGDNDNDVSSEIDLHVAYRRPELFKSNYDLSDEELPVHIMNRLAQIRALALAKYNEVHG